MGVPTASHPALEHSLQRLTVALPPPSTSRLSPLHAVIAPPGDSTRPPGRPANPPPGDATRPSGRPNPPQGDATRHSGRAPTSQPNQTADIDSDGDSEDNSCKICFENEVDCTLYTCGHTCFCYACANEVKNKGDICPLCRQVILDVIKIYKN